MNCPKCGATLRISKKDPRYGLCDNCKKKFKLPENTDPEELPTKESVTKKETPVKKAATEDKPRKKRPSSQDAQKTQTKKKPAKKSNAAGGYYTDEMYDDAQPHHHKKKYANIPPSKVRSSRESEMRSGYDELLSIDNDKPGIGSHILTAIIFIVLIAAIAVGVVFLYNRVRGGAASPVIDAKVVQETELQQADNSDVVYETDDFIVQI